ncbi:DUF418 domain-containing protein [Siminovitchia sp. 179-K 8D1 HS]|uniref:DUF418 domain-containing protein n=1 Tax=Siminovitchia sp. 179-K 8D1 HS TaxID=3142385 RepID=UPI00399FB0AE
MNNSLAPAVCMERIQTLDVLRGFSLFGIILVNMIGFHSPYGYYNPYEWWEYGDLTAYVWIDIFVQGSFYPIFAMLFGYGMVMIQRKALAGGYSFWNIAVRRLLVLLAIGVIHAFFIWYGDILITYALMGLLLLLFLKIPGPFLIGSGMVLYLLPQLLFSGLFILIHLHDGVSLTDYTDIVGLQNSQEIYSSGSYLEVTSQRIADWKMNNLSGGFVLYIFLILPMMMIGAGAAKLKWIEQAKEHWKMWLAIFLIALPAGIAVKLIPFFAGASLSLQYIQDALGGPILGFAYAAGLILLMNSRLAAGVLEPIAAMGRMSLSMYLMQSIVGTLIFYPYGLGLYGKVSLITGTWLAILIYVIQVVLAGIWLSKFKRGPAEMLWRRLTYGKNMKRRSGTNEVNEF